jgi:hypothetical protein
LSELVESGSEAEVFVSGVGTEFVVASSEVLYEGVSVDDHAGGAVGLGAGSRVVP